jgi:hypothetical protein
VSGQTVEIAARTTSFTVVCDACAADAGATGWRGVTFAGRLELDLRSGTFLCRRGHAIRVVRPAAGQAHATEAA